MKKFLSMVLALVMAMSLVTISSSAAFTDAADIDYKEAVEVMTAVGVVDGYTDGSFGPDGYLSRGAAAKIICNMILGPTTASALVADAAPYSDVPADSTFAGYIAYCQKEGIISGYADGTFKPGNSLTGYAFMKMLLGALGYDAEIEGYTGNNWSINVAKQAIALGLNKGLAGEFVGVNTVTRQEALLYAFNTMKATMVKYPNNTQIVVGDIKVTTTASVSDETNTATDYRTNYMVSDGQGGYVAGTDGKLQFCEKYFSGLKATINSADNYGRPATKWTGANNKLIGTYTKAASASYFYAQTYAQLRADLGIPALQAPTFVYQLNAKTPNTHTTAGLPAASTAYNYGWEPAIGRGVRAEYYYDAVASAAGNYANNKLVLTEQYIGKITSVKTDVYGRYVTVDGLNFYTADFAKGDYVIYTVYKNASNVVVIGTMEAAEMVTGTVTWITTNTYANTAEYIQIDGQGYYNHGYDRFDDGTGAVEVALGDQINAWLDGDGYIIKTEITEGATSLDKLVLLTNKVKPVYKDGQGNEVQGDWAAKAIYGDGKTESVALYQAAASEYAVYNYTTVAGKLKVVEPNGYTTVNGTTGVAFDRGDTTIGGIKVNGATGFVYINSTTGAINTYVGYKNAPSIKASKTTKVVALVDNTYNVASVVYVWMPTGSTFNSSNEELWLQTAFAYEYEVSSNGLSNKYHAIKTVDGETVTVSSSAYNTLFTYVYAGAVAVDNLTYDAFGNIDTFTIVSDYYYSVPGTAGRFLEIEVVKDVLYIDDLMNYWGGYADRALAYADDVVVYVVNNAGTACVEGDIDSISGKFLGASYTLNDNGEVEFLVVKEAPANA